MDLSKLRGKKNIPFRFRNEFPDITGELEILPLKKVPERESKIREIEASFEACKSLPVHAANKELQPIEVIPLLPDFERVNDQFVVATFDSNPTADSETYNKLDKSICEACESKAILKSCVIEDSETAGIEKFLALAPLPDEMKNMNNEEEDVSYSWVREYNDDVVDGDDDNPKSYIVSFDSNEARYAPVPTQLKMREKKASKRTSSEVFVRRRPIVETAVSAFLEENDYITGGIFRT